MLHSLSTILLHSGRDADDVALPFQGANYRQVGGDASCCPHRASSGLTVSKFATTVSQCRPTWDHFKPFWHGWLPKFGKYAPVPFNTDESEKLRTVLLKMIDNLRGFLDETSEYLDYSMYRNTVLTCLNFSRISQIFLLYEPFELVGPSLRGFRLCVLVTCVNTWQLCAGTTMISQSRERW